MPKTCTQLRELDLAHSEYAERLERHAVDCPRCAEWLQRRSVLVGVLSSMDRQVAPHELEQRLTEDLELGAVGQLGLLRGLERSHAPLQLDVRLAEALAEPVSSTADQESPAWQHLLGELDRPEAPRVLERLVEEELSDPSAAVTRRFSSGLFRRSSPAVLHQRVSRELTDPGPAPRRHRWLQLGGVAAAGLLVWFLVPSFQGRTASLQVVEVQSLAGMDSFARSFAEALAGGRVEAMQDRGVKPERGAQPDGGQL